jgi:hypothetical protein
VRRCLACDQLLDDDRSGQTCSAECQLIWDASRQFTAHRFGRETGAVMISHWRQLAEHGRLHANGRDFYPATAVRVTDLDK